MSRAHSASYAPGTTRKRLSATAALITWRKVRGIESFLPDRRCILAVLETKIANRLARDPSGPTTAFPATPNCSRASQQGDCLAKEFVRLGNFVDRRTPIEHSQEMSSTDGAALLDNALRNVLRRAGNEL